MIRNVTLKDAEVISNIYNYYIRTSIATLEEKEVTVKLSYNGYAIITSASGFSDKEQILTKGSFGLLGE